MWHRALGHILHTVDHLDELIGVDHRHELVPAPIVGVVVDDDPDIVGSGRYGFDDVQDVYGLRVEEVQGFDTYEITHTDIRTDRGEQIR